ncbi:hypothetical protein LCL90_09255 [Bacillus infantis]|uniref:hypothetical protein n=1 Tax=Bacillus infantis TaxID=324767 RepID=UPI001CD4AA2D|nr:hypothetical protein [Bacillus infantis]MCA1034808.1 hypothetical protein [Bacillus infantis]
MLLSIKRYDKATFAVLAGMVIAANCLLYRTSYLAPVPKGVYWGTLADLYIVLPALVYFLLLRRKHSILYLSPVLFAAYVLSQVIIPDGHLQSANMLQFMLILGEIFIFSAAILGNKQKIWQFYKELNRRNTHDSFLKYNLDKAAGKYFSDSAALRLLMSEIALFHYSLFSWKRKPLTDTGTVFTYHKKKSSTAVYIMLIHATVLESVGLHFFLHQWNAVISYILLIVNVYAVLYFIGELHAMRLTPYLLTQEVLLLQTGLSKSMEVKLSNIESISFYEGPEKFTKKELQTLYDARAIDFMQEKPQIEIRLKEPGKVLMPFGIVQQADRIVLDADEPQAFAEELKSRLPK